MRCLFRKLTSEYHLWIGLLIHIFSKTNAYQRLFPTVLHFLPSRFFFHCTFSSASHLLSVAVYSNSYTSLHSNEPSSLICLMPLKYPIVLILCFRNISWSPYSLTTAEKDHPSLVRVPWLSLQSQNHREKCSFCRSRLLSFLDSRTESILRICRRTATSYDDCTKPAWIPTLPTEGSVLLIKDFSNSACMKRAAPRILWLLRPQQPRTRPLWANRGIDHYGCPGFLTFLDSFPLRQGNDNWKVLVEVQFELFKIRGNAPLPPI